MVCTYPMLVPQVKAEATNMKYAVVPIPTGERKATNGVTDTLMMFQAASVKEEAWRFIEFAYQDKYRSEFDIGEGFLPVTKNIAALPEYTESGHEGVRGRSAGRPLRSVDPELGADG